MTSASILLFWATALFTSVSHAQAARPQWRADDRPVFDVAALDSHGALLHSRLVAATVLRDGRIVAADVMGGALRVFSRDGALEASVGRFGDGPGEFRHVGWLGQCGTDTVYAWDFVLRRMTRLTTSAQMDTQFTVALPPPAVGPPSSVSCSRSGLTAFETFASRPSSPPAAPSIASTKARVSVAASPGKSFGAVLEIAGSDVALFGGGAGPAPLGRKSLVTAGAGWVAVASSDESTVNMFGQDGRLLRAIETGLASRPATRRHFTAAVDEIAASVHGGNAELVRQRLLTIPQPASLPRMAALYSNADELWVAVSHPGDSITTLLGFRADGTPVGQVVLNRPLQVFEVGSDYVLGRYSDRNDDDHLALFRFRRVLR